MADPTWIGYVGLLSGAIGAVTGIYGAFTASNAMRLTSKHKVLDLRLELSKELASADLLLAELPNLLIRANGSRRAIMAASGRLKSGTDQLWELNLTGDEKAITTLRDEFDSFQNIPSSITEAELALWLGEVHVRSQKLKQLHCKYADVLASDEITRRDLAVTGK